MSSVRAGAEGKLLDSTVQDDAEPDLVVIGDDGTYITVEVKVHGTQKVIYTAPKRTLDVVFTPNGIERTGVSVSESRADKPAVDEGQRGDPGTDRRSLKGKFGVRKRRPTR